MLETVHRDHGSLASSKHQIDPLLRAVGSPASHVDDEYGDRMAGSAGLDALNKRYFGQLAKIVEAEIGIKLPASKQTMVEGRLRKRVRALGLANLNAYAEFIFDHEGLADEFIHLVDCVTTNKTDFFREPEHFTLLARDLLPQLFAEWPRGALKRLKCWSAASSNGAEAYSLAMLLADIAGQQGFQFSILGTDICTTVLHQARRAIYPEDMLAAVPSAMRQRFVMHAKDPKRHEMRIVPELRRHVHFERLNLMDSDYWVERNIDVIFCRNILIYFTKEIQERVVRKLAQHLKPGGFLIFGHSESMAGGHQTALQQIAPTVFRRI